MLGTEFQDMLRCIRCGACMNHCPVYHAVGGHAYGWVYPGPMGAVLTPVADRRRQGRPPAQRLDLLRALRERLPGAHPAAQADAALARARVRAASVAGRQSARASPLGASSPGARRSTGSPPARDARRWRWLGRDKGRFASLPLAGGWTQVSRLPGAAGRDVPEQWAAQGAGRSAAR